MFFDLVFLVETPKGVLVSVQKFFRSLGQIPIRRIFRLISHFWPLMVLGTFAAAVLGAAFPLFSVVIRYRTVCDVNLFFFQLVHP